jgi:peptidyl-prolyl cis-trans isomerase A (cyclophilin A)
LRPSIRRSGGQEIASTRVTVPLPRVSMTVEQGDREGVIVLELDAAAAPLTAINFLNYISANFYRNTIFHRVEVGALVEGGAYTTGRNLKSGAGSAIVLESNNGLKNVRGTIAMARGAEPDSATSRFYFNLVDNPALDYGSAELPQGNAVFGIIVSGLDVADEIGKVTTENDTAKGLPKVPVTNVVVTAASQTR